MATRSLDLGCGGNPQNPYNAETLYGIDIRNNNDSPFIFVADLAVDPIPFESNFFDAVTAYDFIEHIPRVIYTPKRRFSFVELMSEIYRVLKPGGLFFSRTPVFPNPELFRDPTHVNFIAHDTFSYYFDERSYASMYGFKGKFKVEQNQIEGFYLYSQLRKV